MPHGDKMQQTCVICGKTFIGYGNNTFPVKDDGVCCDDCNAKHVIFARMNDLKAKQRSRDAERKH